MSDRHFLVLPVERSTVPAREEICRAPNEYLIIDYCPKMLLILKMTNPSSKINFFLDFRMFEFDYDNLKASTSDFFKNGHTVIDLLNHVLYEEKLLVRFLIEHGVPPNILDLPVLIVQVYLLASKLYKFDVYDMLNGEINKTIFDKPTKSLRSILPKPREGMVLIQFYHFSFNPHSFSVLLLQRIVSELYFKSLAKKIHRSRMLDYP